MRYYSPTTGSTYLPSIHEGMIPEDAVPIDEPRFLSVIANPPAGKVRSHDEHGLPFLLDAPLPDTEEQISARYYERYAAINEACEAAITSGFWSSALGQQHQYASQLDDQLNLTGAILAGVDTPFACRDSQGVKDFRPHTIVQLRQVGDDFTSVKLALLQKANSLKQLLDQALAAKDPDALNAVVWETGQ